MILEFPFCRVVARTHLITEAETATYLSDVGQSSVITLTLNIIIILSTPFTCKCRALQHSNFNFWIIFWIYIFVTNHLHFLSSFQNKFHSSDEMLPIELKKTPIKISRSCDSIYQNIKTIRNTDAGGRCPKLPIALGTARILERGGGVCHNRLMKENLHQSDVM